MRKLKLTLLFIIVLATAGFKLQAFAEDNNGDDGGGIDLTSLPGWVIDAALKFINNPDDVFYNFHLDNVDYTPVLETEPATLRTNFLTTFLPFTWGNLNLKIKALSDESYYNWIPQVDVLGSYGRILALDIASKFIDDEDFKLPTMKNYSAGILLTKAVSRETRIYTGFQYSVLSINFEFPEPLEITDETSLSELNINRKDYILVTGITNVIEKNKRIIAYVGYGFSYKKLFSRFAWHYDHLEIGFNIYPEALLVIHPFLGWHWNF